MSLSTGILTESMIVLVFLLLSQALKEQGVVFGVARKSRGVGVFVEGGLAAGHVIKSILDGVGLTLYA